MACSQNSNTKPAGKKNTPAVGGGCEGCEAIYESPVPFEQLKSVDTLPDFNDAGPKLEISGIVYRQFDFWRKKLISALFFCNHNFFIPISY